MKYNQTIAICFIVLISIHSSALAMLYSIVKDC